LKKWGRGRGQWKYNRWINLFRVNCIHVWDYHNVIPSHDNFKIKLADRHWLTPVILATQEDCGSKLIWANSLLDSILISPSQTRAGGMAQRVCPEFKAQYCKKIFFK
jgi:hypothetical protein